jgi:hypothetical protein
LASTRQASLEVLVGLGEVRSVFLPVRVAGPAGGSVDRAARLQRLHARFGANHLINPTQKKNKRRLLYVRV